MLSYILALQIIQANFTGFVFLSGGSKILPPHMCIAHAVCKRERDKNVICPTNEDVASTCDETLQDKYIYHYSVTKTKKIFVIFTMKIFRYLREKHFCLHTHMHKILCSQNI